MKPILVICLGNPLMKDEGIGTRLALPLQESLDDNPDIEVLDLGTGGLSIMHAIIGRKKVVFVDCAIMGREPGTIQRFTPQDVRTTRTRMRYSLHEGDLLNTLDLSHRMGECPEDIVIFGIEPKAIAHGRGLTDELEQNITKYVRIILKELGIKNNKQK
jgi:hydrogenase maturation protease